MHIMNTCISRAKQTIFIANMINDFALQRNMLRVYMYMWPCVLVIDNDDVL